MTHTYSGWRKDLEPVSAGTASFTARIYDAPKEVDHRDWLKVEHQGSIGSCTGHACTTALEICNYIQTQGQIIQLNRMFSYITGQEACGLVGKDQGSTIAGVVNAARGAGICPEEVWPYSGRYTTRVPQRAREAANNHKLRQWTRLNSYGQIFDFLAMGQGAVILGIRWTSEYADTDGIIRKVKGRNLGGHALAFTGYTAMRDSRRNRLILTNSHGKGWGRGGHAQVVADVVDEWCEDDYTDCF